MRRLPLLIALLFFALSPIHATSVTAELLRVGGAYGADHWDQVESIQFTVHITKGTSTIERKWLWDVKDDQVTLETTGKNGPTRISYARKSLEEADGATKQAENWFINDQYWLLFPLHLMWDNEPTVSLEGEDKLPMGRGQAARMIVTFPKETGGELAGDIYEIFYGPIKGASEAMPAPPDQPRWDESPFIFREWIVRKAGAARPTYITNWDAYKRLGPLVVATDHRSKDHTFRVSFTDLSLKLVGDAQWHGPEPVDAGAKKKKR